MGHQSHAECRVPLGTRDTSATNVDRVKIVSMFSFIITLAAPFADEGGEGNQSMQAKPLTEFLKMGCVKVQILKLQLKYKPALQHSRQEHAGKADMLTLTPRVAPPIRISFSKVLCILIPSDSPPILISFGLVFVSLFQVTPHQYLPFLV